MDVLCLGLIVCDILVKPVDADIMSRDSARVDFVRMGSGGDAFNAAIGLARMGINTGAAGKVGSDGFGRYLLDSAAEAGVSTSNVIVSDTVGTAVSVVLIQRNGERSFAYHGGANDSLSLGDIGMDALAGVKVLHIGSAFELPGLDGDMAALLRQAKERGVTTVLDVTGNPDNRRMEALKNMLPYVDVFLPSRPEAEAMTGETDIARMAGLFCEMGATTAVIKDGSKGCFVRSGVQSFQVPAFRVDAVDTTGAGDAFAAGYIAGIVRGVDAQGCARFANAAGALCACHMGATAWARPYKEVIDWMDEHVR
jgi:sugar/nucleoside kinase (ribokinase family)